MQRLVQERPSTCRPRWLRLLQLGDEPARLIKDIGRGRVLHCLRLRGVERLLLVRLLGWLRGLRDPLRQLLKNGPHGLRNALMQSLTQEGPGTCGLRCLRCLRLRGALGGAWPLLLGRLLGRLRGARLDRGSLVPLCLLPW